jgi:hypothetical protein
MAVQTTFNEYIRQGIPGMINSMVDYNAVTRSAATVNGIPPARAVSQGVADIECTLGGANVNLFIGITIVDPTVVKPTTDVLTPVGSYPQYQNVGILTKGEMFVTAAVATTTGDPLHFDATDGTLSNTGGIGPVPGASWKFSRPAGELNVVKLGIQR